MATPSLKSREPVPEGTDIDTIGYKGLLTLRATHSFPNWFPPLLAAPWPWSPLERGLVWGPEWGPGGEIAPPFLSEESWMGKWRPSESTCLRARLRPWPNVGTDAFLDAVDG